MAVRPPARVTKPEASPCYRVDGQGESNVQQPDLFKFHPKRSRSPQPQEWKIISLRECPTPEQMQLCDTPDRAVCYWREHVIRHPAYNPEVENFVVLLLNTRRRIKGHVFVATGTLDTILVHPREVFRAAIVANAAAMILGHNHPSGEESPSEADIKVTRDLIRAGQLMKIEVLDHVIVGNPGHSSLKTLGYFFA